MPTPELNKALAAFQAELPEITKGQHAHVEGREGRRSYDYDYADLADVAKVVLKAIGGHGLSYTASPTQDTEGRLVLDYALLHSSGEERGGVFPLWLFMPPKANSQTGGGLVTYWRRYCLLGVTGVHPRGEDDDAAQASQQKPGALPRNKDGSVSRRRTTDEQKDAAGLMTAAQHAEHTALRKDAAEGTVPGTTRVRNRSGETPWEVPLADPANPGGNGRIDAIRMHFERLGITDRGVRLGYTQTLTGTTITTSKELTQDQRGRLLKMLEKCRDRDALDRLRDQAQEAKA